MGTAASIDVYIDGQCVGSVGYDDHEDFEVSPGVHELYVKMEWLSSKPIKVRSSKSPYIRFAMQSYKVILPSVNPLELLVKFTIKHKSAISLVKVFDDRV